MTWPRAHTLPSALPEGSAWPSLLGVPACLAPPLPVLVGEGGPAGADAGACAAPLLLAPDGRAGRRTGVLGSMGLELRSTAAAQGPEGVAGWAFLGGAGSALEEAAASGVGRGGGRVEGGAGGASVLGGGLTGALAVLGTAEALTGTGASGAGAACVRERVEGELMDGRASRWGRGSKA
jgi:hypothetical protein